MTVLDRFKTKLHALRSWFEENHPPSYGIEHGFILAEPLTEATIQQIEGQFGVTLPPDYRAFLKRFGVGRVGPGNYFYHVEEGLNAASFQPFPLARPYLGTCSPEHNQLTKDAQWEDYGRLLKEWEAIPKDRGVLQLSDYGCAIYGVLVLNGLFCGKVWILSGDAAYYGPFGGAEALHDECAPTEWEPTDAPKDYSFFEWYESWLDGWLKIAAILPR